MSVLYIMKKEYFQSVGHRRSSAWVLRVVRSRKQLPLDLFTNRPIINTRMKVYTTVKMYFVQKGEPSVLLLWNQHFSFQIATSVYSVINATRLIYFVLPIIHSPPPCQHFGTKIVFQSKNVSKPNEMSYVTNIHWLIQRIFKIVN
jgi:hypothetical protein